MDHKDEIKTKKWMDLTFKERLQYFGYYYFISLFANIIQLMGAISCLFILLKGDTFIGFDTIFLPGLGTMLALINLVKYMEWN